WIPGARWVSDRTALPPRTVRPAGPSARPGDFPDRPADLGPEGQRGRILSHPDEAAEELHVEGDSEVLPDERRPRQAAGEVPRRRAAQVEPFLVPLPGQEQPQLLPALRQPGVLHRRRAVAALEVREERRDPAGDGGPTAEAAELVDRFPER